MGFGSGIRDPNKTIPDPEVKKAPDPGSAPPDPGPLNLNVALGMIWIHKIGYRIIIEKDSSLKIF